MQENLDSCKTTPLPITNIGYLKDINDREILTMGHKLANISTSWKEGFKPEKLMDAEGLGIF